MSLKQWKTNVSTCLVFLLFSAIVYFFIIPNYVEGAELFPQISVIFIAVLSLLYLIRLIINKEKYIKVETSIVKEDFAENNSKYTQLLIITLFFIVYIFLLNIFGFLVSGYLFLMASIFYLGYNWVKSLIYPIIIIFVIHLIFNVALNFRLP